MNESDEASFSVAEKYQNFCESEKLRLRIFYEIGTFVKIFAGRKNKYSGLKHLLALDKNCKNTEYSLYTTISYYL